MNLFVVRISASAVVACASIAAPSIAWAAPKNSKPSKFVRRNACEAGLTGKSWLDRRLEEKKQEKASREQEIFWKKLLVVFNSFDLHEGKFESASRQMGLTGTAKAFEDHQDFLEPLHAFFSAKFVPVIAHRDFRKQLKPPILERLMETVLHFENGKPWLEEYFKLYHAIPLNYEDPLDGRAVPLVHELLVNPGLRAQCDFSPELERAFAETVNFGGYPYVRYVEENRGPVVAAAPIDPLNSIRPELERLAGEFTERYRPRGLALSRAEIESRFGSALVHGVFREALPEDLRLAVEGFIEEDPFLLARLIRALFHYERRLPSLARPNERFARVALEKWLFHRALSPRHFSKLLNRQLKREYPEIGLLQDAAAEEVESDAPASPSVDPLVSGDAPSHLEQAITAEDWASFEIEIDRAQREGRTVLFYSNEGRCHKGKLLAYGSDKLTLSSGYGIAEVGRADINPATLIVLGDRSVNAAEKEMPSPVTDSKPGQRFHVELGDEAKSLMDQLRSGEYVREWGGRDGEIERKITKVIEFLESNPAHPGLNSKDISQTVGLFNGFRVFQSYLENNRPGAGRVYWIFGPGRRQISILSVQKHPVTSRDYLSAMRKGQL